MKNPYVLWLDLETTGNQPDDEIIEVGLVLTNADMVEVDAFSQVYRTTRSISDIDPVVQKMHFENGLWIDTHKAETTAVDSQENILGWLGSRGAIGRGLDRLPLAGSGVSHFDRRYIAKYWPALDVRLTFWAYDVGAVRRFVRFAGMPMPESDETIKTHRALDDIRLHLTEWQVYTALFRQLWSEGMADATEPQRE